MISLEDAGTLVHDPDATDAQLEEVFRLFPTCHLDLVARNDLPQSLLELIANTSPSLEAQHQARCRLGMTDQNTAPASRPAVLPDEAYTEATPTGNTVIAGSPSPATSVQSVKIDKSAEPVASADSPAGSGKSADPLSQATSAEATKGAASSDPYTPPTERRQQYRSRALHTAVSATHGPLPYEARLQRTQQNTSGALLVAAILFALLIVALIFLIVRLLTVPDALSSFDIIDLSSVVGSRLGPLT